MTSLARGRTCVTSAKLRIIDFFSLYFFYFLLYREKMLLMLQKPRNRWYYWLNRCNIYCNILPQRC